MPRISWKTNASNATEMLAVIHLRNKQNKTKQLFATPNMGKRYPATRPDLYICGDVLLTSELDDYYKY